MNNLNWYINLYYKFRDYPISQLNSSYKPNELKTLYATIVRKLFLLFQLDNRKQGEIQNLISKNNYDLMNNKRAESNLAQQEQFTTKIGQNKIDSSRNVHLQEKENIPKEEESLKSIVSNGESEVIVSQISRDSPSKWTVEPSPNEKNMDVFYQLMIKMIRISLRRLMIETFTLDKFGKNIKKQTIKEIFKNNSEYQKENDKNKESKIQSQNVEIITYPINTEEMKFQFLKYCIFSKVYNNPRAQSQYTQSISENRSISSNVSMPSKKLVPQIPKLQKGQIRDEDIQQLIMKVSEQQTSIFNKIIDMYQTQIKNSSKNKRQVNCVNLIAQSIIDLVDQGELKGRSNSILKKKDRNQQIFIQREFKSSTKSNKIDNSNILLATWFDLILFKESPNMLLDIIEEMVKMQSIANSQQKAERAENSQQKHQNTDFYYKISSFLHLLILNSTKNIFVQSLLKINYLLVLSKDVIGDGNNSKYSFKQIFFKNYQEKVGLKLKIHQNYQLTYNVKQKRYLWKEQAMAILFEKWKIIANVITDVCVNNNNTFFAAIFQKCVTLLNKQLEIQVQLIQKLMMIAQNISSESNQGQSQKSEHVCRTLYGIIRQIIGFGQKWLQDEEGSPEDKYLKINNILNNKSQSDRYKESTFANREEYAQQLQKWNDIINQNIYVYTQYKNNLEKISKIFKNHYIYTALWFNKFHTETKLIVRRFQKQKVETIFQKFQAEILVLWDYMTNDNCKGKSQSRFRRNERNKFRNRISSIKLQKNLNLLQKKAIVFNYMIKAQLELYSHYMLINYLNSQKNFAQYFQKQTVDQTLIKTKPQLFDHNIIKKLTLFPQEVQYPPQNNSQIYSENKKQSKFSRKQHRIQTFDSLNGNKADFGVQTIRSMHHLEKGKVRSEIDDLINAIHHFQKPMDIELDLKQNWKEKYGESQIEYLSELNDYIRYINEINYLYELWSWTDSKNGSKRQQEEPFKPEKKKIVSLLDGSEYREDLHEIDKHFKEIYKNQQIVNEILMIQGDSQKVLEKEKLNQMLKRIKVHNKELYLINQTITQGENYFNLIEANMIGRDKNSKFKQILQEIICFYKKNSNRQKVNVRMFDKIKENMQYDHELNKGNSIFIDKNIKQSVNINQKISNSTPLTENTNNKALKKSGAKLSHFQFTPQYYKIQSKIFRVNCLIASFDINNKIFRNIKHNKVLSKERLQRLTIIGGPFYSKLQSLLSTDDSFLCNEMMIGEDTLQKVKTNYEKKILLFIVTLINMNYNIDEKIKKNTIKNKLNGRRPQFTNIPEKDTINYKAALQKYCELLKKYLYKRIKQNIKRVQERQNFQKMNVESQKKDKKEFKVCKFLQDILQLSEKNDQLSEQLLLLNLQIQIEKEDNLKFSYEFKNTFQEQATNLNSYTTEQQKVEYLRKKLSYLLLRQIYFILNYQNEFLCEKSINSKKNYFIYEERILKFFQQIIKLDYEEYVERKQEEIKKRSIHLKDYQFKYEQQPPISQLQITINQLICCLYNQLLSTYTTKVQKSLITYKTKGIVGAKQKNFHIYQNYCASEYLKEIPQQKIIKAQKKQVLKKKGKKYINRQSINQIFAHIFMQKQNKNQHSSGFVQNIAEKQNKIKYASVLVYTIQKFDLSESIKVYLKILQENHNKYHFQDAPEKERLGMKTVSIWKQQPISQKDLAMIRDNERSLITLLKAKELSVIHNFKCNLIRKNLLLNIERLYINLDVRHKVFQSFQDRVLNYEMQKARIYHQYMDYIRGLKLDVYSHMAGQDPYHYIKIISGVKLYRLKIKKQELQKRASQQFDKNLKKWNIGIQNKLLQYNIWLKDEETQWKEKLDHYQQDKRNLLDIYHIVCKEFQRQNKKKQSQKATNKTYISNNSIQLKQDIKFQKEISPVIMQPTSFLKKSSYKSKEYLHKSRKNLTIMNQSKALKFSVTDSTKPITKYERITFGSKSQTGFRGFSIKFDNTNYSAKEQNLNDRTRMTQTVLNRGSKTASSTFYTKNKRYQSAQKYRQKNDN